MQILYSRCCGIDVHKDSVTAFVLVYGEGKDPNRILAKQFLDRPEREIAPLDMDQFGWRTSLGDHRYEIGVRSHHGIAILPRPIQDRPVISLFEVNIAHMDQAGEQRCPGEESVAVRRLSSSSRLKRGLPGARRRRRTGRQQRSQLFQGLDAHP